jgi:hypothetical protein
MVDENLVRLEHANPSAWKRTMRVNADKDGCRARASAMWPRSSKEWALAKDDGRAEAALLAEYGRLTWQARESKAAGR